MARGYIYILFNPGLRSNQFKIGLTTQSPDERARDLSRATGVPQPFEVAYSVQVEDCGAAERLVHDTLHRYRVGKEFFELPLRVAVDAMSEIATTVGRVPEDSSAEGPGGTSAYPDTETDYEVAFSTPSTSKQPRATARSPSRGGAEAVTFESHLQKTDHVRQEILIHLRTMVKGLGGDIVETVTRANRIAYSRGRVFLEVKVHKDRIRILFLDIRLNDPEDVVVKVPESHGWGRLKFLMNLRNMQDLDYGMQFVKASYAVAK
jgi:predicted transport protein